MNTIFANNKTLENSDFFSSQIVQNSHKNVHKTLRTYEIGRPSSRTCASSFNSKTKTIINNNSIEDELKSNE